MSGEAYLIGARHAAEAIREAADVIRVGEGESDEDIHSERVVLARILRAVYPLARMATYHAAGDSTLDREAWLAALLDLAEEVDVAVYLAQMGLHSTEGAS